MGLGTVNQSRSTYLSIAGGFIWNRKADESDPNYATQTYERKDGTKGLRKGAQYADVTGKITGVVFRTHPEYGESINVKIDDGTPESYIISISTNNRYSQDMMKALLLGDLQKTFFIKPYDFIGNDKKRAMGISFRQNGEKIALKIDDAPSKESDWFKSATKKEIRRFFEDLNDWYVEKVQMEVVPNLDDSPAVKEVAEVVEENVPGGEVKEAKVETKAEEVKEEVAETPKEEVKLPTPLKMKRALKDYIDENYEGEELPTLSKKDLIEWYTLAQNLEELPFKKEESKVETQDVDVDELDSQLDSLMGK